MRIAPKNGDLVVHRCPFCGSRAVRVSNTHTACYTVACDGCGGEITGKSCEKTWRSSRAKVADHLTAIRSAVTKWNERCFEVDDEPGLALLDCHILWGEGARFSDLGGTFGCLRASIGYMP